MASRSASLSDQALGLIKAYPELALLLAFEVGKVAAATAQRREPFGRALWHSATDVASRTGASAALAAFFWKIVADSVPLAPNGKRRRAS